MNDLIDNVSALTAMTSPWEVIAVVLAVIYLALTIRQNIWCWAAAFVSTSIYLMLMYRAHLYMESALQVFYIGMAIYGWYEWRHGPGPDHSLPVSCWSPLQHVGIIIGILCVTLISGRLLSEYSTAALPYVDSFTTWAAIVATFMVARKILENWLYWFVIDSVSIGLYINRELYLTSLLFAGYLVLIVIGYWSWRKGLQEVQSA